MGRYGLHYSALCPRARPPLRSAGNFPVSLAQPAAVAARSSTATGDTRKRTCVLYVSTHVKKQLITGGASTPYRNVQTQHSPNVKFQKFPRATRKVLSARHSDSDVLLTFQFFNFLWLGGKLLGTKEFSRSEKRLLLSAPFLHVRDVFYTSTTHSQPGGVVRVALKLAVLATP